MPTDLSKKRVLCIDHGYFVWLALRLSRDFGEVYYHRYGWEDAQAKLDKRIIGDGFEEISSVAEPWGLIDRREVDAVIFCDVYHAELQEHIESLGIPVWGARHADRLETGKLNWKQLQPHLGLTCQPYDVIEGIEALREYCQKNTGRVIKVTPQYRGHRETFINDDYAESRCIIDHLAAELDLLQDLVKFVAEKKIKSKIEGGIDTYTVDGQHPDLCVYGFERKDRGYFATVKPYREIPEEIRGPSDLLWDYLGKLGARQFISSEVMVEETGKSHLIDNTLRIPSPAGEEQGELYKNLAQILYEGAQGRLVQPEVDEVFACEAMIEHKGDCQNFRSLEIPKEEMQWIKLYNCFLAETRYGPRIGIAPMAHDIIGAVVGIGHSPKEALAQLLHNAKCLKNQPVTVHTESLASLLLEIEESEEKGMKFTDAPMPDPADVLS